MKTKNTVSSANFDSSVGESYDGWRGDSRSLTIPAMKSKLPIFFLATALFLSVFTLVTDGTFRQLDSMRQSAASQHEKNSQLKNEIAALSSTVRGIKSNDRVLEKAARNELGLARPNEMLFVFEDSALEPKAGTKTTHDDKQN